MIGYLMNKKQMVKPFVFLSTTYTHSLKVVKTNGYVYKFHCFLKIFRFIGRAENESK